MFTLMVMVALIIQIVLFAGYLKINGLGSLFTTNVYKEAASEVNIFTIDLLAGVMIGFVIGGAIGILMDNESEAEEDAAFEEICKDYDLL